ncbi:MAG: NAD(+)/NADH kinase [Candidatus Zixiibacteriota bacterium]|jgi:NAD+ kinase
MAATESYIFGIVANWKQKDAVDGVSSCLEALRKRGQRYVIEERTAVWGNLKGDRVAIHEMGDACDLVISFGGDGTLLSVGRLVAANEVPVLAVNLGGLGFLSEMDISLMEAAVDAILTDRFLVESRMLLAIRLDRASGEVERDILAVNDVVMGPKAISRIVTVNAYIHRERLFTYRGDGVIAATPTGSTAYSLSAGGPIVDPRVDLLLLTPICAHSLTVRPLVIPPNLEVGIDVATRGKEEVVMTVDGQTAYALGEGDRVYVTRAKKRLRLIRLEEKDFYKLLQEKLGWGIHQYVPAPRGEG